MSTKLSTMVGSCTSSTCFRVGILRQAQSACSTTCSCLLRWWRASSLGTGYTSYLCCCRRRLSCGSTTSLCTPPCCPSATTQTLPALCCFCTYGLASTGGGCKTAAWMTWHKSNVLFLCIIIGLHGCFVHNGSCLASTIQRATILVSVIAANRICRGFRSLLSITEDLVVVPFDDCSHVWHTTVAQLQGVPVEYFAQLRVLRKCLLISDRNLLPMFVATLLRLMQDQDTGAFARRAKQRLYVTASIQNRHSVPGPLEEQETVEDGNELKRTTEGGRKYFRRWAEWQWGAARDEWFQRRFWVRVDAGDTCSLSVALFYDYILCKYENKLQTKVKKFSRQRPKRAITSRCVVTHPESFCCSRVLQATPQRGDADQSFSKTSNEQRTSPYPSFKHSSFEQKHWQISAVPYQTYETKFHTKRLLFECISISLSWSAASVFCAFIVDPHPAVTCPALNET